MYVLDASVILKWYLQEADSDRALMFKQEYVAGIYNLALPDLILYELPNALRYKNAFSSEAAYDAATTLIDLGINIVVPTKSLIRDAMSFSHEMDITFYDAAYVSLALELGYEFVTADVKLFKKIKRLKFAKLLSELSF